MKIGVIGIGVIGNATKEVFEGVHELFLYDKFKRPYSEEEYLDRLVLNAEVIFLCLPTPMKPSGEIDYSPVYNSLDQIVKKVMQFKRNPEDILIVIRSTAVSGSSDKFNQEYPFRFTINPEFLRQNHAVEDMKKTDRVIIGASSLEDFEKVAQVYRPIFPTAKYFHVDRKTAEMIKYCNNVFLAGQVSLANEIYHICEKIGVDYQKVKEVISLDPRIGTHLDVPGPDGDFGFGGSCFPKDINALIYLAREKMYRPYLLEEMWRLNERVRKNKDWLNEAGSSFEENVEKKKSDFI